MSAAAPPLDAALPEVTAVRYVTALREGGSLPGLMEADDLGTYVVKFTGAGQGRAALVAEVIVGELARSLGLAVPALVCVDLDPGLARNEPDHEIQDLLRRSPGRNLGVDFLPGALDLDARAFAVDERWAGQVLWLDAYVNNVDRSWRNPNLLLWHGVPYVIDHGAALTFQHSWTGAAAAAVRPYDAREHALLSCRPDLDAATAPTPAQLSAAVAAVPEEWLTDTAGFGSVDAVRTAYREWLAARLGAVDQWLPGVREAIAAGPGERLPAGRVRPRRLR